MRSDMNLLKELIALFRKDAHRMLLDMEEAIKHHDSRKLASSAHAFVGSLGNFAAPRALEKARELERRARSGALADCDVLLASLVEENKRLEAALQVFLDGEG